MTPSEFLILSVLIVSLIAGFIGVFLNFFGTWIIFFGTLFYAYQTHFLSFTPKFLVVLAGLALFSELMEYVFSHFGIKKMGGGSRSVAGAFLGGILGAAFGALFFGIGVVAGGLLGVFLGAALMEMTRSGDAAKSVKVGFGGLLGVAGSLLLKIIIALVMIELIVVRLF